MSQDEERRKLAQRIAALSPEKRALLELVLQEQEPPRPAATADRHGGRIAPGILFRGTAPNQAQAHVNDELRRLLLHEVDLAACERVLVAGCGTGQELIALAQRFQAMPGAPGFRIWGHMSRPEQVEIARALVQAGGLADRITVETGVGAGVPGQERDQGEHLAWPAEGFDLVLGLEAMDAAGDEHGDFAALIAAAGERLAEGGRLVIADVFLKTALSLPRSDGLALPAEADLIALLSANRFSIAGCVDVAEEVAGYLHDAGRDEHEEDLLDPNLDPNLDSEPGDARAELAGAYDQKSQKSKLATLLRGGAAGYLLLRAERCSEHEPDALAEQNRARIAAARRYWQLPQRWLYAPRWQPAAHQRSQGDGPDSSQAGPHPAHSLVLADRGGVAKDVARRLREAGGTCTMVYRGEEFRRNRDGSFTLSPRSPEAHAQLLKALGDAAPALSHVFHLWSLDAPAAGGLTAGEVQEEALDACSGVLYLAQALLEGRASASPSLWLVTRGAQVVGDTGDVPGLVAAPLWGLGQAIAYEHPELACVRVDLDPRPDSDAAGSLWSEILASDRDDQIAFRGGARHVLRLTRHRQWDGDAAGRLQLRPDATYLITGGLGGLGLLIARWMVSRGARYLVLLGSSRASDVAAAEVRQMRAQGAAVVSLAGVSVASDLDFVMAEMTAHLPPLRGIIHAAAEVDDGILLHQTRERFSRVFAAKVAGAWNLHRWAEDKDLDFFLLVSSSTSLMGASGQGNHIAATAFLDALAHYRRGHGVPGQSSSWGAWSQPKGDAKGDNDSALAQRMRERGVGIMAPAQCMEVLEQLLDHAPAVTGVMPIHWPTFLGRFASDQVPPLFAGFADAVADSGAAGRGGDRVQRALIDRIRGQAPAEARGALLAYVQERVARVLELDPGQPPEAEQTLHELGLDSLMAVDLKNMLLTELAIEVPMELLLTGKSLAELADFLDQALRSGAS